MTTRTASLSTWMFQSGTADTAPKIADGVVKDLKIFKAGTMKDSRGRQKTWTADELNEIVANFETLRSRSLLVDVPVREDHTQTIANVKGYFTGMRTDGTFLYGDIGFTEPDGAEKYERGTYRSRSIEIGSYETNGAKPEHFKNVALGLAFVDIGAVEGLYRNSNLEDDDMGTELSTFRVRGVPTTDVTAVQAHIDALETVKPPVHEFRVGGAATTDFAAVQARIDALETFQAESVTNGRASFVKQLEAEKKIASPQVAGLTEFAQGLDAAQFATWSKTFETAPALFAKAGDGNGATSPEGNKSAAEIEADNCAEVVRMHRMGRMPEEQVRESQSFKRYMALTGHAPA